MKQLFLLIAFIFVTGGAFAQTDTMLNVAGLPPLTMIVEVSYFDTNNVKKVWGSELTKITNITVTEKQALGLDEIKFDLETPVWKNRWEKFQPTQRTVTIPLYYGRFISKKDAPSQAIALPANTLKIIVQQDAQGSESPLKYYLHVKNGSKSLYQHRVAQFE